MCSSGGQISQTDEALQKAQATMTNNLNADYATTFAEQQGVLNQQVSRLQAIAANPMGYTPAQLHTATTSINENTANAAKAAIGSAAAFAAAHGGADVGGGPAAQVAGQVATGAAQSKAQQLSALSTANEQMKQSNFWNAISGLNSAGSELGGAGGTAIGGAGRAADSAVGAGSGALAAQQAGWQDIGSVLSGVGGLVGSAVGLGGLFKPGPQASSVTAMGGDPAGP
jgi:hypothetical protein